MFGFCRAHSDFDHCILDPTLQSIPEIGKHCSMYPKPLKWKPPDIIKHDFWQLLTALSLSFPLICFANLFENYFQQCCLNNLSFVGTLFSVWVSKVFSSSFISLYTLSSLKKANKYYCVFYVPISFQCCYKETIEIVAI